MTNILLFTYIIIFAALVFDFLNGFHDAANSVATVVSTGLLKPFFPSQGGGSGGFNINLGG